ncbi:hypothetical protein [Brevundimonas sp.]|uniref:hypothetical protein n=1 Tax=Brevundimonas sp. TaxID=1871086 RepID=UPI003BAAD13B
MSGKRRQKERRTTDGEGAVYTVIDRQNPKLGRNPDQTTGLKIGDDDRGGAIIVGIQKYDSDPQRLRSVAGDRLHGIVEAVGDASLSHSSSRFAKQNLPSLPLAAASLAPPYAPVSGKKKPHPKVRRKSIGRKRPGRARRPEASKVNLGCSAQRVKPFGAIFDHAALRPFAVRHAPQGFRATKRPCDHALRDAASAR